MLQSKAGYIDARPLTASSAKPLATHGRTIHSGQTEKSGLAHRQVRFAFKNGHRQCGYWSRSSRKCPLAIAPRQFTCRSFLHLQGGAIEGRHHGLHQPVLGNVGVRTFVWFREEGSRRNPVRRKRTSNQRALNHLEDRKSTRL